MYMYNAEYGRSAIESQVNPGQGVRSPWKPDLFTYSSRMIQLCGNHDYDVTHYKQ